VAWETMVRNWGKKINTEEGKTFRRKLHAKEGSEVSLNEGKRKVPERESGKYTTSTAGESRTVRGTV